MQGSSEELGRRRQNPLEQVSLQVLSFVRHMYMYICIGTWHMARAILHLFSRNSHSIGIAFLHVFIVCADPFNNIFRGYIPWRAASIMCTFLRHFKSE